jgi:hypothetical protein
VQTIASGFAPRKWRERVRDIWMTPAKDVARALCRDCDRRLLIERIGTLRSPADETRGDNGGGGESATDCAYANGLICTPPGWALQSAVAVGQRFVGRGACI